jgi:uncharacterized membrane protein
MTNLIVLLFETKEQALAASKKLTELESHGAISIYEKIIIQKNANNKIVALDSNTTKGLPVFFAAAMGAIIGAIAGPAGMIAGLLTGTLAGKALELNFGRFSTDITSKVAKELKPGMVAIILESMNRVPCW